MSILAFLIMALSVGTCSTPLSQTHFSVVVDPGHGGRDVGALADGRKRYEKDVTLAISKMLAARLAGNSKISVVMTRNDDRYLSLVQRRMIVASCKPNLVLSVHADSGPPLARGASVYVLNESGEAIVVDRLSRHTAANRPDDLAYILAHLQQRESVNFSATLSAEISKALGQRDTHVRQPRSANFALLKSAGIPSILVETGFISNKDDAIRLFDPAEQAGIAEAVAGPIMKVSRRYR